MKRTEAEDCGPILVVFITLCFLAQVISERRLAVTTGRNDVL